MQASVYAIVRSETCESTGESNSYENVRITIPWEESISFGGFGDDLSPSDNFVAYPPDGAYEIVMLKEVDSIPDDVPENGVNESSDLGGEIFEVGSRGVDIEATTV